MKRIGYTIYVVAGLAMSLLLWSGCARRVQLTDEELAQIFHDAFLANAYTSQGNISLDSLRLYEPIFQKYGYTTEDVQYTIGSFSTRKSARLSDVVERAISMLEIHGVYLDKQVEVLDYIDEQAQQRSSSIIFSDSVREVRSLRDSMRLVVSVENMPAGTYDISFDYLIDSMSKETEMYRCRSWFERDVVSTDEQGKELIESSKLSVNNAILRKGEIAHFERTLITINPMDRLKIELVSHSDSLATQYIKVRNIEVKHTPDKEDALERLFQKSIGVTLFDDELLFGGTTATNK